MSMLLPHLYVLLEHNESYDVMMGVFMNGKKLEPEFGLYAFACIVWG